MMPSTLRAGDFALAVMRAPAAWHAAFKQTSALVPHRRSYFIHLPQARALRATTQRTRTFETGAGSAR